MNILLTGHTGFIGSFLSNTMSNHYSMFGLSLSGKEELLVPLQQIDTIIHTSGIAHLSRNTPKKLYEKINTYQTIDLAEKSKKEGVTHFIYFSSVKVYGDRIKVFDESVECNPTDYYGQSKLDAEKKLLHLEDNNFHVTILRLPLVYGSNPKGNIKLLLKLVKCPFIPLGKINNKRSILSLSNLAEYLKQVIDTKIYGILIPSDTKPVSTTEMMSYMVKAQKAKSRIFGMPMVFRTLLRRIIPSLYIRLFSDFYAKNDETLNKFNLDNINETEKEFCSFFGKVKS